MKSIFFLFLCFGFISCSNSEQANNPPITPRTIVTKMLILEKEEFNKKLASTTTAQLIDVRTADEVAGGAIPNSVNYDYYEADFKSKILALDKEKPVLVYCKSGARSGKTMKIMQKAGFKEIYDLKGGYTNWSK